VAAQAPAAVQGPAAVQAPSAQAQQAAAAPPPAAAEPAQAPELPVAPGQRRYTGTPVSFDFQDADLRAVLRTFHEITGLNIVIDPAVQGTVNVALTDVPWDQALDIILRANKLGYIVDGTIVRIAPLSALADEETQRRRLAEEQALSGELRVLTKTLSYARAQDLVQLLTRSTLSQRGTVQVDARTNTLIITDLQARLTTAEELLTTLDKPQPQVEIEARIVQANKNYSRQLGVQWGFNGRVDPALGNTTNLAFPNSGAISGNVDLPGPSSSAINLALGSVNGAFNLDAALTAAENSGNARVLSTPRVSTQNNIEAEIAQGVQIPYQTVANNTVTTSFKDAALVMRVKPQITAAGTVIMTIMVDKGSPGAIFNGIPSINTQRANTTVLLNDGETTVIGGIYEGNQRNSIDRTPGLGSIPFLSWLFKRESVTDDTTELLIFITPRIMRG
jgi:type IV pilus assembly protein PilQ